jgi:hypothetical protein
MVGVEKDGEEWYLPDKTVISMKPFMSAGMKSIARVDLAILAALKVLGSASRHQPAIAERNSVRPPARALTSNAAKGPR